MAPDGKFSVKLSLKTVPKFALTVSAEVIGADGRPIPGSGTELILASWLLGSEGPSIFPEMGHNVRHSLAFQ